MSGNYQFDCRYCGGEEPFCGCNEREDKKWREEEEKQRLDREHEKELKRLEKMSPEERAREREKKEERARERERKKNEEEQEKKNKIAKEQKKKTEWLNSLSKNDRDAYEREILLEAKLKIIERKMKIRQEQAERKQKEKQNRKERGIIFLAGSGCLFFFVLLYYVFVLSAYLTNWAVELIGIIFDYILRLF